MKHLPRLIPSIVLLVVSIYCARCEQLSTVFVLETSDSSPALISNERDSSSPSAGQGDHKLASNDTNTRIITDDTASSVQKPPKDSQVVVIHHSNHETSKIHLQNNHSAVTAPTVQHQAHHNSSASNDHHQANHPDKTSRRLEEESQHNSQVQKNNMARSAQVSRPKSTTTTTTTASPYEEDSSNLGSQQSTPKTEERLLISITSDEDDYRPPQKQTGSSSSSSSSQDDELRPPNQLQVQQQQQQPHKRKPSITISIQDANIGKQNGGSGSSGAAAVIVRPSENGQSIVISTQGGSSSLTGSGGQNKPTFAIVSSNGEFQQQQQVRPVSSSTYRPPVNDEYQPASSRPIISTLVEPTRPPVQQVVGVVNEERPQRPVVSLPSSDSESAVTFEGGQQQPRPSSRPVIRPPVQEPPTSSFNQNDQEEVSRPVNSNGPQAESKYPLNEKNCGLVHETRIVGGDEADPADFLWMAAIIKSKPTEKGDPRPFCGGSLITRRHILTAAHCLENLAPRDVLVRLGSYDFDDATASSLSADFAIDQFRVPAHYSKKTHASDIAIMRLKTPLTPTDNYKTVCMPQARRSYVGAVGKVTGYGSQSQTFRRAAPKLRQVTVPIWENRKCSAVYKRNLTESFLCAGYEEGGKDACQGDSGGPLMIEGPNERMMVVGVVSHGIGCGSPGYPGVYTRTTTYLDWIEKNTRE